MILCLAGNQNCGKTTLFNGLTGMHQHVGNWPGVTVERKSGSARSAPEVEIVDLPGVYSLSPYTMEERVTRDYLLSAEADGIINIVDATRIERNLYLTLQLRELRKPLVVALNMMDEARAAGITFDIHALERELGVSVIPISARGGEGVGRLMAKARETAERGHIPPVTDICSGPLHEALHAIAHLVEAKARKVNLPVRYAATKLIEGDEPVACRLALDEPERHIIGEIKARMEDTLDAEGDCALADARYSYIEGLVRKHVLSHAHRVTRSDRIDRVLTHRVAAIPLFFAVMAVVFGLTFGPGALLSAWFARLLGLLTQGAETALNAAGASPWLSGLVTEGALGGVFTMLGFLPVILTLFFCLSLLEDTGYMARAAFVTDRLLRSFGLSGRAFIPMLMGFGCSVPAILATRAMGSAKERRLTIFITPFMSCAARLPIYALFVAAFFDRRGALVMTAVYMLGLVVALLCALALKDLPPFKADAAPFVMELPPYRLPTLKTVLRLLWDKARDFIRRAFTIIFAASVIIWCLSSLDTHLRPMDAARDKSESLLAAAGGWIAPVFEPLGFGDWRSATSVIAGLTAKEAVVSTLAVLHDTGEDALPDAIRDAFTPLTAWSFMVFILLYMPCAAAFAVMKRELGKLRYALAAAAGQTTVAWLCAFVVFQVGRLLFR